MVIVDLLFLNYITSLLISSHTFESQQLGKGPSPRPEELASSTKNEKFHIYADYYECPKR